MVYVEGNAQIPRKEETGKLVGISSEREAELDREAGIYKSLKLKIVKEVEGKAQWFNFLLFGPEKGKALRLAELPELKKADELLSHGQKPTVRFRYYESDKVVKDEKTGEKKIYTNTKMSYKDLKEFFKVIEEAAPAASSGL